MSSGIYNKITGYHNRRSIRLPGYDYSQPGYYFVTICIHDRKQNLFADIVDAEMVENEYGAIVRTELMVTEKIRPNIKIDTCIIMPNHVHVILGIRDVRIDVPVGAYCNTPLRESTGIVAIHTTIGYTPTKFMPPFARATRIQNTICITIGNHWRRCSRN